MDRLWFETDKRKAHDSSGDFRLGRRTPEKERISIFTYSRRTSERQSNLEAKTEPALLSAGDRQSQIGAAVRSLAGQTPRPRTQSAGLRGRHSEVGDHGSVSRAGIRSEGIRSRLVTSSPGLSMYQGKGGLRHSQLLAREPGTRGERGEHPD